MEVEMSELKGYIAGQYQPLRQDQIGRIHQTALRILEEVGVRVECEEARSILQAAGATADPEHRRIFIRPRIVERALYSAPSSIRLCGRAEEHDLLAEGSRTYLGTGGAAINVIDLESGNCRPSTTTLGST